MKIFIGSSTESLDLVREIEVWIEEQNYQPLPWDQPGLFPPGSSTLHQLIEISRQVDGAIFLFTEDDKVWYRSDTSLQPRDNVLMEYGLFVGSLGPHKAIILTNGNPRGASDIHGISHIDINEKRRARGKLETNIWCRNLTKDIADPALIQSQAKIFELQRKNDEIQNRLNFEVEKSKELSSMLTDNGIIDFNEYDVKKDGHWKLLFNYEYVFKVSKALEEIFKNSKNFFGHLSNLETPLVGYINVDHRDLNRFSFYIRKSLRVFRMQNDPKHYLEFVKSLKSDQYRLDNIANSLIMGNKI